MYVIHMEINRRIAQRIKALCKEKGMRQLDLADAIGYPIQTLRAKFASQNRFNIDDLELIANALGVPLAMIMVDNETDLDFLLRHHEKMGRIAKALDAETDPHDLFVAIQTVIDIHRSRDAEKERQTENI